MPTISVIQFYNLRIWIDRCLVWTEGNKPNILAMDFAYSKDYVFSKLGMFGKLGERIAIRSIFKPHSNLILRAYKIVSSIDREIGMKLLP